MHLSVARTVDTALIREGVLISDVVFLYTSVCS